MNPPAMYAPAIVSALESARRGSGRSRPSSKRIMKSIQAAGRRRSASTTGAVSAADSPYAWKTCRISSASTSGTVSTSRCSRARSLALCSASLRAARYPPSPIAIDPAAISASPAVTMTRVEATAPDSPAARAKGTVSPSDIPMTISRTVSRAVKWRSTCGVCGMAAPGDIKWPAGRRLPHDQDRHLGPVEDPLAYAAEEQPPDPPETTAAHDDEIGLRFLGHLDDLAGRIATAVDFAHGDIDAGKLRCRALQDRLACALQPFVQRPVVDHRVGAGPSERVDRHVTDVDEDHLRSGELPYQPRGEGGCADRVLRSIGCDEHPDHPPRPPFLVRRPAARAQATSRFISSNCSFVSSPAA